MTERISLKDAERKVFQSTMADGLWDVYIGSFVLMLAVAPLLSVYLGDFWSAAVFLPFFGAVYLGIWLARKYVVSPRLGKVTFGKARVKRLFKFNILMLVINVVALVLGVIAALTFEQTSGGLMAGILSVILIVGFSSAAYLLDYPRLYAYGLVLLIAPLVGEWLYQNHGATHHGYPIVFGFSSGLMIVMGLVTFARFLTSNPPIPEGE